MTKSLEEISDMVSAFIDKYKWKYKRWTYHVADMKELAIRFGMSPYRYWWINFKIWVKSKTIWRIRDAIKKPIFRKHKES